MDLSEKGSSCGDRKLLNLAFTFLSCLINRFLLLALAIQLMLCCYPGLALAATMTIHINPESVQAADTNAGTEVFPLKTIAAGLKLAAQNRNAGMATQILIYPGLYRESLRLDLQPSLTDAAMTLEAVGPEPVIISGSQVWPNWNQSQNTDIYTHAWPFNWGLAGNPWQEYEINLAPIVQRGEMVFVNGQQMKQVLSLAELTAGSFYISEPENLIYLYPGDRLQPAAVEVAIQPAILRLSNASNLTLRGLIFEHAASAFSSAVSISNSANILIDGCQFRWNNWAGLKVSESHDVTIKNSIASHNGLKGITADHVTNLNLTDVVSSFNNWRGAWGKFYDWDAGEKYFYIHGGRFENYRAIANQAAGLWLDTDNQDIVIDHGFFAHNAVTGLFLEAGPGPITVKNSIIYNNYQVADNYLQTPGLFAWSAANVTVENNLIFGNEFAQVGVRDLYPRQVEGKPNETGTLVSKDWIFRNNVVLATDPTQKLLVTLKAQPFLESLRSDNNIWSVSTANAANQTPGQANLAFQLDQRRLSFQQWQSELGQDQESLFLDSQTQAATQTSD